MMLGGQQNQSALKTSLEKLFSSILSDANISTVKKQLIEADTLLAQCDVVDLQDFELEVNGINYAFNDLVELSSALPQFEPLKSTLITWTQANKVIGLNLAQLEEPITQEINAQEPPGPPSIVQTQIDPAKEKYLQKDNAYLRDLLAEELKNQSLGTSKSKYAWTFKSGQETLRNGKDDNDEINIFFLGTSTPPLFGIHNIDVCESGHVICQAALQKAQLGRATLLVKGIATADMDEQFPMEALDKPSIFGGGSGYTTVKGTGADTRLTVTMEQFFIPTLFKMLINKPLAMRDNLTINLSGHSRGGITTFIMADCADQFINFLVNKQEGVDYKLSELAQTYQIEEAQLASIIADLKENHQKIKTKVCALDPVEGARSMAQWDHFLTWREGKYIPQIGVKVKGIKAPFNCSYTEMPARVSNAMVFLASDERRSGFRPTIPTFAPTTEFSCKQIAGKHGTLTGNFGNDGNQGQFMFKTFEGDPILKDAILGIFDETLININEFISHDGELPPFPRNTVRRIFNQPEYDNTKKLLLDVLSSHMDINDLDEDTLVEECEKLMLANEKSNIIFYDSLYHDAKNAMMHQKSKILNLEKDWRHDTNVGAVIDRDAWEKERRVYIRGMKVGGTVKWHEFKLDEVAPTRLPEPFYYQHHVNFTSTSASSSEGSPSTSALAYDVALEGLFAEFYQLKNKIELIANSPQMTREQKQAALFNKEFSTVLSSLTRLSTDGRHHGLINKMISELMIDIVSRYKICNDKKIQNYFEANNLEVDFNKLNYDCMQEQVDALQTYFAKDGINILSLDEVSAFYDHVCDLEEKLPSENEDSLAFLRELKAKALVQEEIDSYINALEVYIESKMTMTGQTADVAQDLHKVLSKIRTSLINKSADDVKRELQVMIEVYIQGKEHQSYLGKIMKKDPASVAALKSAEKHIHGKQMNRDITRVTKALELPNLKADLTLYIQSMSDYIGSFKWRSPDKDTVALKDHLLVLKEKITDGVEEEDLIAIRIEMNKLIENYINSHPASLTGGDSPSVKALKNVKEELYKQRFEEAQRQLQPIERKERKNVL